MIAKNLISEDILPLRTSDTGDEALALMSIYHVKHLPIVNNEQFLGLVSDDDIYEHNSEEPIGSYFLRLVKPYVKQDEHIFEVMDVMAKGKLTVVPVVDHEDNFLGIITQDEMLQFYANSFSFSEPGSILVIETTKSNYSLTEISRIVEEESAVIIGAFLSTTEDTNMVTVTIKINKSNIQNIIASFQRYDYTIKGSFYEDDYFDDLKSRYDSLMSYLNV